VTSCGGCCDHVSISGAETHAVVAMTTFTKQKTNGADWPLHNNKPTYKSANAKYLFFDSTRWRVADTLGGDGGDVQSAEADTYCPSDAWGWEAYFARGAEGYWAAETPVSVACDCPCSQLSLDAKGFHKSGLSRGSAQYEIAAVGDGGRPIYKDYVGQSLMWSAATYSWYTSYEATADNAVGAPARGLSTTTAASTAFCPVDVPAAAWLPAGDTDVAVTCGCKCTQVEVEVTLDEAAASAGIFTMGSATAGGRPVFVNGKGTLYLFYYGPALRWMIGASYASEAGVVVRSSINAGYCPITASSSWWAKQTDGTWRDDSVTASCVPYSFKPPAPPPPLPPFDTLCACPIYKATASGPIDYWAKYLLTSRSWAVDEVASGKPHNGGRPVMTTTKKLWDKDYHMYYYNGDSRWHIAGHNDPMGWSTTYRSAVSTSDFCANGAVGWEKRSGREWSPIGVTINFECVNFSPPAPPPTLISSSMITCLPQMTQDACGYFASKAGRPFDKDKKVCFGQKEGGFDACDKDEGAPLVVHGAHAKMVQVGVASKVGCGAAETPTEYTKVAKYLPWITVQVADAKAKCMQTCPVDGCTNVASPGARTCRGHCQICNSFGWG